MWTNKIKSFLLDAIYPVKCLGCGKSETLICHQCFKKLMSMANSPIYRQDMGFEKMIIALNYKEHIVEKIIKTFKYPPYIKSLKKILALALTTAIQNFPNDISYLKKNNFVLSPVPLSRLKLAQRGFNQSELLSAELSQKLSLKHRPNLLKKNKNTKSQTNLNFEQRKANVQNVFVVKSDNCPPNIILVDDICTSGATLQAASHALRQAGVKKIWAFVLAKGQKI
ncbi:hypothetical protein B6D52_02930 [Candidatus Parcubacteria bacterium 4484_255]|nr:MAG: hypothetical protein B6D52_02930 [Candidatus Parcubacteria bacterium 4484_255]